MRKYDLFTKDDENVGDKFVQSVDVTALKENVNVDSITERDLGCHNNPA